VSAYELPLYLVLGMLIGVTAVAYIRIFYRVKDGFERMRMSPLLKPVLGAFLVGCMAIALPQVLGNGYDVIESVLHERTAAWVIVALILAKIVATSVTLGSGGAGGVFAPALLIGAATGGSFGSLAHALFPSVTATPGAYATVGIGAFLAAVTHAPLTGIFLLFEMTGNYKIIVPLMTVSIIGTMVSKRLSPDSIDTLDLTRKGIRLRGGREADILSRIPVRSVMTPGAVTVKRNATLQQVLEAMIGQERFYLPVVDDNGSMRGIVSIQDVRPVLLEEKVTRIVNAGDIATEKVIVLTTDDDLNTAMEKFGLKDIEEIPVVDPHDPLRPIGMLKRRDVIAAYNKEVLRKESGQSEDAF
jgi:CIC family chloride channel protein